MQRVSRGIQPPSFVSMPTKAALVRLSEVEQQLGFEVFDDGKGFDQARVARGAGLTNMEDRLDALAGKLAIASEPGRFTRISGGLPLRVSEAVL